RDLWRPVSMHTHVQMESIANGKVDIGLCWIPTVHEPLVATPLASCPFVVVASEDDPLTLRPQLTLADLRGRRIVVSSRQVNQFIDARLQSAFVQSGVTASHVDEVDGYDEVALLVATRGAIGIHPASIVGVNRVPGIAFRRLCEPDLDIEVSALHRIADTERLAGLIDLLRRVTAASIDRALGALVGTGDATAVETPVSRVNNPVHDDHA
ncbi:MAG: LysR family substrate-binding domain-containing protein, partial [Aeromicrobium sp.]